MMNNGLKTLPGNRDAGDEQGSCGIRKRLLDGVPMEVKEGDVVEIPPKVVHQAIPAPEMTILVVMSPYNAEKCDIEYL